MQQAPATGEALPFRPTVAIVALTVAAAAAAGCSSEPLEFADWIIAVGEGVPVHEYAPVSADQRDPDAILLTEAMVVGADLSSPDAAVFRPAYVVGTEDGTIFVADVAMNRVQMYGRDGHYLRTLGQEGQGPAEFASLSAMTIAGDLLVIDDRNNDRFSAWTLDGVHAGDYRKAPGVAARTRDMRGQADGTLIVRSTDFVGDETRRIVSRISLEGQEMERLDEMVPAAPVIPERSWTPRDMGQAFIGLFDDPTRDFAVGASGTYVTPVLQYQVLALSAEGTPRWALRVAGPRAAISSGVREYVLEVATEGRGGLAEQDLEWPTEFQALADVLTDGRGRLYVVPNIAYEGDAPSRMPVDVYSTDGQRVAAGYLPARWSEQVARFLAPWTHAAGDYVYGLREDADGETVAVRYRLVIKPRP